MTPLELFNAYLQMAEQIGGAACVRYMGVRGMDRDDIMQEARIALWQACLRFDASKGFAFKSFAKHRIHGAIVDFARNVDPRSHEGRVMDNNRYKEPFTMLSEGIDRIRATDVDPEQQAISQRMDDWLHVSISKLKPKWRDFLESFLTDEPGLIEMGRRFSVNESRACQIRLAAIKALKRDMAAAA